MSTLLPVVVPVDGLGDVRAVATATRLASVIGAPVRVLSVVPDDALAKERTEIVSDALGRFDDVEVLVVTHHSVDEAICDAGAGAAWVCMTTAATLLPHEGHLGSIAESVVRSIGRPVMLVGPKASGFLDATVTRLVVPVDGSSASEFILEPAARLAAILDLEPWVVTVVTPSQERQAEEAVGHDLGVIESSYVRRLAQRLGPRAQYEVLHRDDPGPAILDFAYPDAIVAMSTHGRSGLARIVAGSVTRDVVAASAQPVMVVRPPRQALLG